MPSNTEIINRALANIGQEDHLNLDHCTEIRPRTNTESYMELKKHLLNFIPSASGPTVLRPGYYGIDYARPGEDLSAAVKYMMNKRGEIEIKQIWFGEMYKTTWRGSIRRFVWRWQYRLQSTRSTFRVWIGNLSNAVRSMLQQR